MAPVLCECAADGYCSRYGREMRGRFREICAGVNVDLGTAAAFRAQWAAEAGHPAAGTGGTIDSTSPQYLLLKTDQAPGDALAMTAAIHSLHRAYPGRYVTGVESQHSDVFRHNPDVSPAHPDMQPLAMHYPAIEESNRRAIHFMQAWCEFLGFALGVHVPLLTERPRLYFDTPDPPTEDYWVICSGVKSDFTAKRWGHDRYQQVVDRLWPMRFVQVGAAEDDHRPLRGLYKCLLGRTTLRGLFGVVRRSRGVLCGVSLLMHVAAALEKPAVVVAGGREPVTWNAYPRQQYIHTCGLFPCPDSRGRPGAACWRSAAGPPEAPGACLRPTSAKDGPVPECLAAIPPAAVAEAVKRYNDCGGVARTKQRGAPPTTTK